MNHEPCEDPHRAASMTPAVRSPHVPEPAPRAMAIPAPQFPTDAARFRRIVDTYLDFTWRSLRRLGLPADVADDATQRVFLVVSRRLGSIEPGSERAFLFNAAVHVALSEKRTFARRRETLAGEDLREIPDAAANADELLDQHRARTVLDEVLLELDMDIRTVFVLYELEGMTTAEIGLTLGLPRGTAASRLRRAREAFRSALKRRRSARATRRE
jgi:RNA polymerase sigma-70 factor (ECF subfamily)